MALGAKVVTVSDSSGTVSTKRLHAGKAGRTDGGEEPSLRSRQRLRQAGRRRLPGRACAPGMCRSTSPCRAPRRTSWTATTPRRWSRTASSAWPKAPTCHPRRGREGLRRQRRALCPGQGQQRRRCGHLRPGNEPERHAPVVERRTKVDARLHGIMCQHPRSLPWPRPPTQTARSATSTAPTSPASSRWPMPCWPRA
jgi:hypothetical protein